MLTFTSYRVASAIAESTAGAIIVVKFRTAATGAITVIVTASSALAVLFSKMDLLYKTDQSEQVTG